MLVGVSPRGGGIPPSLLARAMILVSLPAENSAKMAMPLNIKDPAFEKVVRELAAATGETLTAAVHRAAEERLQRGAARSDRAQPRRANFGNRQAVCHARGPSPRRRDPRLRRARAALLD